MFLLRRRRAVRCLRVRYADDVTKTHDSSEISLKFTDIHLLTLCLLGFDMSLVHAADSSSRQRGLYRQRTGDPTTRRYGCDLFRSYSPGHPTAVYSLRCIW